jgi:hypothetical protein
MGMEWEEVERRSVAMSMAIDGTTPKIVVNESDHVCNWTTTGKSTSDLNPISNIHIIQVSSTV